MVVQHNIAALNNNRQLSITNGALAKTTRKLSSGYQINIAADNAAGLSISEKMRKQIRGLNRASQNSEEGISLIQTAEGALNEVHDMLQRMNELCVQAANGTNSDTDRRYIQDEIDQIISEIDRVAETTKFNEIYLLDGTLASKNGRRDADLEYQKYMTEKDYTVTILNGQYTGDTQSLKEVWADDGTKILYKEIIHGDIGATSNPDPNTPTASGYTNFKQVLKTEIVPQAIEAIMDALPNTYSYLKGSTIGIGLDIYSDPTSSVLAAVELGAAGYGYGNNWTLDYTLHVNIATLGITSSADTLTSTARNDLEVTIVHEMVHAMMDEAMTAGMLGYTQASGFQTSLEFPDWFVEGMAQVVSGGCYNNNDWINNGGNSASVYDGLGITASTSVNDIKTIVQGSDNKIGNGTTPSRYGTGYLACMYLGYLADGTGAVTQSALSNGIDSILSNIRSGKSLESVIQGLTGLTISDFQNNFGGVINGDDSAVFIQKMITVIGNETGGLGTGFDQTTSTILPDAISNIGIFELNTDYAVVSNTYPSGHVVMSGGTSTQDGVAGPAAGTPTIPSTPATPSTPTTPDTPTTPTDPDDEQMIEVEISKTWYDAKGLNLQIGAESHNWMHLYIEAMDAESIKASDVDVTTQDRATMSIDIVAFAIHRVSRQRSSLGAYQNRLEHTIKNLDNIEENTQAAESQIRDTDMAEEIEKNSNLRILQQAGQAMLSHTKQEKEGVLTLLQ